MTDFSQPYNPYRAVAKLEAEPASAMDRAVALVVAAVEEASGGPPASDMARAMEVTALRQRRTVLIAELAHIDELILEREIVAARDLRSSDPLWSRRYKSRRRLAQVDAVLGDRVTS